MMRTRRAIGLTVEQTPVGEINTTPLIDVMLVLLILCIISVPMVNHRVPIRFPDRGATPISNEPQVHELTMSDAGSLSWDGIPISQAELPARLRTVQHEPDSILQIRTSGEARYEEFNRMLVTVRRAGIERLDFIGNQGFAEALDRR